MVKLQKNGRGQQDRVEGDFTPRKLLIEEFQALEKNARCRPGRGNEYQEGG
jgi:hypothetical protein